MFMMTSFLDYDGRRRWRGGPLELYTAPAIPTTGCPDISSLSI
jgi:hypothetical protein